jgi:hypothetical protein
MSSSRAMFNTLQLIHYPIPIIIGPRSIFVFQCNAQGGGNSAIMYGICHVILLQAPQYRQTWQASGDCIPPLPYNLIRHRDPFLFPASLFSSAEPSEVLLILFYFFLSCVLPYQIKLQLSTIYTTIFINIMRYCII